MSHVTRALTGLSASQYEVRLLRASMVWFRSTAPQWLLVGISLPLQPALFYQSRIASNSSEGCPFLLPALGPSSFAFSGLVSLLQESAEVASAIDYSCAYCCILEQSGSR